MADESPSPALAVAVVIHSPELETFRSSSKLRFPISCVGGTAGGGDGEADCTI